MTKANTSGVGEYNSSQEMDYKYLWKIAQPIMKNNALLQYSYDIS